VRGLPPVFSVLTQTLHLSSLPSEFFRNCLLIGRAMVLLDVSLCAWPTGAPAGGVSEIAHKSRKKAGEAFATINTP
jgi:hypothetical protein